ncbi:MAG: hypothetical protein CM15mP128_3470 [Methanobacteriota archaeon]|nr:MAG: hypothetical protein CM15mP128_3470 [Euryarchaeota archaeon]
MRAAPSLCGDVGPPNATHAEKDPITTKNLMQQGLNGAIRNGPVGSIIRSDPPKPVHMRPKSTADQLSAPRSLDSSGATLRVTLLSMTRQ